MPRYQVLRKSYLNDRLVAAGEIVEYDGEPGENLKLIEPEKPAKKEGKEPN